MVSLGLKPIPFAAATQKAFQQPAREPLIKLRNNTFYLLILVLGASQCRVDHTIDYADVPSNVSFESVMALPHGGSGIELYYGNDALQYGLLWLPGTAVSPPYPLIVFVHGGCWLNAYDIRHSFPLSTALSQAGYAVWSLEYRRTGDVGGGWPGTYDDISAGLAYAENLESYGVDTRDIILIGHSAGGHLALLAGTTYTDASAVIGLAAISNIVDYARGSNDCETATPQFMGGDYAELPDSYELANPTGKIPHINTYLLQGTADEIVPLVQAQLEGTRRILLDDAGHMDWIHPGTKAFGLLLSIIQDLGGH